ncbi:MAG: restriction endonuclease [Defluviitaleaceae bacterium]|nr:restriction endonuclease [Defluviitaleaceae bacterium]
MLRYKFHDFFRPVLEVIKDGNVYSSKEIIARVDKHMNLTNEEKDDLIKSGGEPKYVNRIAWARTYLKAAGLILNPERAKFQITDLGIQLLNKYDVIDLKTLEQYPEFLEFQNRKGRKARTKNNDYDLSNGSKENSIENNDDLTPQEKLDSALNEINTQIYTELKEKLQTVDPYKFEIICKDLLIAMGYGGSSEELSYVTKRSGDGGIDAVIKQDPLGISTIYVQSKRYKGKVSEKDIRDFLGALAQKTTRNGIFITTGYFSNAATQAIISANNMNIIKIDGDSLVDYMFKYKLGTEVKNTYVEYRINYDYFDEL